MSVGEIRAGLINYFRPGSSQNFRPVETSSVVIPNMRMFKFPKILVYRSSNII